MNVLVIGGIYHYENTIVGGISIAKLIGKYSSGNVHFLSNFSTNETKLSRKLKKTLREHGVNSSISRDVSIDYGIISNDGVKLNTNNYELNITNRLFDLLRSIDILVFTGDIYMAHLRSFFRTADNMGVKIIVMGQSEDDYDNLPNDAQLILYGERWYVDDLEYIKKDFVERGIINEKPVKRNFRNQVPHPIFGRLFNMYQLIVFGVIVFSLLLLVFMFLQSMSDHEDFPVFVDDDAYVEHEMCDTVESCSDYGDDLIDEISQYVNLQDRNYIFHENRSRTNYLTFHVNESNEFIERHEHESLPFGTEEEFLQRWEIFTKIAPDDILSNVNRFRLFSDGEGGTLAYVSIQNGGNMLALDIRDYHSRAREYETMIHEIGHLYSLPIEDFTCGTTSISCLKQDAMLYDYIERFWSQYGDRWFKNASQSGPEREAFYNYNFSHFYEPYQATNVKEDYAITFMTFILSKAPQNPVQLKDIKVKSLYEEPELVSMRIEILENILEIEKEHNE